jgi:hypothetical protein
LQAPLDAAEAVLSINVRGGDATDCGVQAQVSCSTDGTRWSDWFGMLAWGIAVKDSGGTLHSADGEVDVDMLKLLRPARLWRYRLNWHDPHRRMAIARVALCVTDPAHAASHTEEPNRSAWGTRLDVPFLSQWNARTLPADRLCSPTAVAMVSRFYGGHVDTEQVAELAFDATSDLYGNWSFNVLAASLVGLAGYVDRGHSLGYLEDKIASGRPVIASIAFDTGALENAPIPRSSGHLVVVCGFTDQGDVVVRDPACRTPDGRITYRRDSFAKAWLSHGGTVYLLAKDNT